MKTIRVYFQSWKQEAEEGYIWISFYIKGEKVNFSTKVKCKEKDFDKRTCRIKTADKLSSDKNIIIDNILARINSVFVKYRLRNKTLTKDSFFRAYNRPDDYDTFFAFIKDYEKKFSFKNELSTIKVHNSVLKKVEEHAPDLHFDDITTDWLDEYYSYLRKDLKNNENTAYKNMSTFRKYVRAAWKAGYMEENPFENWSIRRTKASYTYLTEDELNKLFDLYKSGDIGSKYYKTLEFFLFMCLSSLHIGDARNLKLEQFTQDNLIYYRLKNRNKKPEPIYVPISASLHWLMKNIVGFRKQGQVFTDLPADQTMNNYLKEIARMAEIDKQISHKTGRHTFATYFLAKTKDLTALKDILGHSELRETLIYAHVLDESKQEGIKCFDSLIRQE